MVVRSKRAESIIRRRRQGRRDHLADHLAPGERIAVGRMRHGGPPQDHALYACQCGVAFHATVSTSVSCPHCGLPQAW